jgi:hypothetical protein
VGGEGAGSSSESHRVREDERARRAADREDERSEQALLRNIQQRNGDGHSRLGSRGGYGGRGGLNGHVPSHPGSRRGGL